MSLRIIHYPHPTLRHVSKPLRRVDTELRQMLEQMLELMYEANGIGLAANQVDLPYRMFVLNLTGDRDQPEHAQVFINPVILDRKGTCEAEEGCLSLPGLYGEVRRPEKITLTYFNLAGQEQTRQLSGLEARAAQHEIDHLDGILFIDKLTETGKLAAKDELTEFEERFYRFRDAGEIPSDPAIAARLAEFEKLRT